MCSPLSHVKERGDKYGGVGQGLGAKVEEGIVRMRVIYYAARRDCLVEFGMLGGAVVVSLIWPHRHSRRLAA